MVRRLIKLPHNNLKQYKKVLVRLEMYYLIIHRRSICRFIDKQIGHKGNRAKNSQVFFSLFTRSIGDGSYFLSGWDSYLAKGKWCFCSTSLGCYGSRCSAFATCASTCNGWALKSFNSAINSVVMLLEQPPQISDTVKLSVSRKIST